MQLSPPQKKPNKQKQTNNNNIETPFVLCIIQVLYLYFICDQLKKYTIKPFFSHDFTVRNSSQANNWCVIRIQFLSYSKELSFVIPQSSTLNSVPHKMYPVSFPCGLLHDLHKVCYKNTRATTKAGILHIYSATQKREPLKVEVSTVFILNHNKVNMTWQANGAFTPNPIWGKDLSLPSILHFFTPIWRIIRISCVERKGRRINILSKSVLRATKIW